MVKITKSAAQKNRDSLTGAASKSIRRDGIANASIQAIAAAAGLTHGAVYRHFPDKNGLAVAAVDNSFDRIIMLLEDLTAAGGSPQTYVRTYLTQDHRDHFDWGCPVAPLAAEIFRSPEPVQTAFSIGLRRNIEALSDLISTGGVENPRARSIVMLAGLSGAMAMARATASTDPGLSAEILKTAADALCRP